LFPRDPQLGNRDGRNRCHVLCRSRGNKYLASRVPRGDAGMDLPLRLRVVPERPSWRFSWPLLSARARLRTTWLGSAGTWLRGRPPVGCSATLRRCRVVVSRPGPTCQRRRFFRWEGVTDAAGGGAAAPSICGANPKLFDSSPRERRFPGVTLGVTPEPTHLEQKQWHCSPRSMPDTSKGRPPC
jgi:hypothetical protein